ncbi:hypothetical protein BKA67DRAFT_544378 [Truncatella angustata]|uniref:Uncharacterized protein n=1 Tax=Truncatella angustata TaxID=152316 RepID=A0A9P8UWT8_9PEZI|nr:uncharacterized protein BKA67DRAFT_544378 [Truncatella angustata]KAH6659414.1 hypothetical protein BKA67DRAFT_544378 [Truncatella angustata]
MAKTSMRNLLFRLPPATLALFLSTVISLAHAHALPRQTTTVESHELHVIAWPPIPTEAPLSPFELLRRQEDNTICGYIGDLPATCSAGSHCVLDKQHNVMGCCPNGGPCTQGVYTGCIDYNSGEQTEANPYVYTCQGSDVCYKNEFGGGVYQYGCGTASDLATSVQASLSGVDALVITSSVPLTATPTTLSEPISINPSTGTRSFSSTSDTASQISSTRSSSTRSSTSSSLSSSPSTTASSSSSTSSQTTSTSTGSTSSTSLAGATSSSSPTSTTAPATASHFDQTGAIVGGTISGVAILIAIVAIAIFCIQKRRNRRLGPGPVPKAPPSSEYMSPIRSHGAAFAPLPTWQEEEEPPTPQPRYHQSYGQPHNQPYNQATQEANLYSPHDLPHGNTTQITGGQHAAQQNYSYPSGPATGAMAETTPIADAHTRNGANELDDFSHGYSAAVGQIQHHEEDRQPLTPVNIDGHSSGSDSSSPSRRMGDRPLWQQNRRQSRNLMWM